MAPLWFGIVKDYPGNVVGPTVPFVLGATRDAPDKAPASAEIGKDELGTLLTTMEAETPAGYGVRIQWCEPKVKAHVVAVVDGGKSLTWENIYGYDVHDIESLVDALWDLYGSDISDGRYSKNGDWHKFTDPELATIRAFRDSDTHPF